MLRGWWTKARSAAQRFWRSDKEQAQRFWRWVVYTREPPIVATFIATLALIATIWIGLATQLANSRELDAFRDQLVEVERQSSSAESQLALAEREFVSSSRPIVVPVPDPELRFYERQRGFIQFKVQNASNAPALSGSVVIVPPEPGRELGCPPGARWSERNQPGLAPMPPLAPGQIEIARIEPIFDTLVFLGPNKGLCTSVQYKDAAGVEWMTEWSWSNEYSLSSGGYQWSPAAVRTCRLETNPQTPANSYFISCATNSAND